uniref:Reverse transcriptase domain-containing protein n=1 Tax=Leptobrachium leishanense TaxID=445787 RepID=A0A8C5LTV4_9ANUR
MSVLGETYLLVNIYAPHPPHLKFFSDLYSTLLQYTFTHCIIGGDFNAVLDPVLDRSRVGSCPAPLRASVGPRFLKDHLALFDAWRYINPEGRDYSFYSHPHDSFSRIDMFLLSSTCYHSIVDAKIGMIHISDHAPVTIDLQLKTPLPRSRNWRFPTALLHSSDFKAHLELSWNNYLDDNLEHVDDVNLFWEAAKPVMRGCIIEYMSRKRKEVNKRLLEAHSSLVNSYRTHVAYPTSLTSERYKADKQSYARIADEKAQYSWLHQKNRFFRWGNKSGKLLANLLKFQRPTAPAITRIKAPTGEIVTDPSDINRLFRDYFETFYKAELDEWTVQARFFVSAGMPELDPELKESLSAPISSTDITAAISRLRPAKTPGPDGFSAEYYKLLEGHLVPHLLSLFNNILQGKAPPPSFNMSRMIMIPKPDKDPLLITSYRPISLLNTDLKLLSAIMARRLQAPLAQFISPAQTGFLTGRHSTQNVRKALAAIWSSNNRTCSSDLILSCDADKAFDRISWSYIRRFLKYHSFGVPILNLFNALYDTPAAMVTTNGLNSSSFILERGTRQGCPLSPLLFNLALEPLLRILQTCPDLSGIRVGSQEVRIVAFADDLLLFLSQPDKALPTLVTYLEEFHLASGFQINYNKTLAIPLGANCGNSIRQHCPFTWCLTGTFKYLGVIIPTNIARLYEVNVRPLLSQLKTQLTSWAKLPLSYLGRCNLIKMVAFPRLLYPMQMLPLLLKRTDIAHIHALFTRFIWNGGKPRIALRKLQLPYNMGGLNLPDIYSYNIAALYRIVADWISNSSRYTDCALDRAMCFPMSPLAVLHTPLAKIPPTQRFNPLLFAGREAWYRARKMRGLSWTSSIFQPLLRNPAFQSGSAAAAFQVLATKDITQIGHLVSGPAHSLVSYRDLCVLVAPASLHPVYYMQLSAFVSTQLNSLHPQDFSNPLDAQTSLNPSTAALRALLRPQFDWSVATSGLAAWCVQLPKQSPFTLISATNRLRKQIPSAQYDEMFLKLLHKAYIAPDRLVHLTPLSSGHCLKCRHANADLFHCLWACPLIAIFWNSIRRFGDRILHISVPTTPDWALFGLLSDCERSGLDRNRRTLLGVISAVAKKAILGNWIASSPPTFSMFYSRLYALFQYDWVETALHKDDNVQQFFGKWEYFMLCLPETTIVKLKRDFEYTTWYLTRSLSSPPLQPNVMSRLELEKFFF